jgi:hypothetical protein
MSFPSGTMVESTITIFGDSICYFPCPCERFAVPCCHG